MQILLIILTSVILLSTVSITQTCEDYRNLPIVAYFKPLIDTMGARGCFKRNNAREVSVEMALGCIDNSTGNFLTNCYVTITSLPCEGSGWHPHRGGRPAGEFSPSQGMVGNDPTRPGLLVTQYTPPEVAGEEVLYMCCFCPGHFFGCSAMAKIGIRVDGLQPLGGKDFYVIYDKGEHGKFDHYINPLYRDDFEKIVKWFYETYDGRKLMVNDVSLPWGGLLDIHSNWSEPHCGHREGKHIDVRFYVVDKDGEVRYFFNKERRRFIKGFARKHTSVVIEEHPPGRAHHFHIRPKRR